MPATSLVYSVVAPAVLKRLVASSYPLRPTDCRLLAVNVTHTYEVRARDKRYALRLYCRGWRTAAAIAYELAALRHVTARGASVSAPLARRDRKWVTSVAAPEGVRPAVLFTWCDGREKVADPDAARAYGEGLARLHNASDDFVRRCPGRDIDVDCLVTRPLAIMQAALAGRPEDAARLEKIAAAIAREIRRRRAGLSWGFCHGDPCAANARIKDGVTTFFDFDFCGHGWRSYDLANFLWGLSVHNVDDLPAKWNAFLEGYRRQRPIRRDDLAAVPLFVAARQLWLLGLQVGNTDRWGSWWVNESYFDFNLKIVWDWSDFRYPKSLRPKSLT
jgi:Ser/Thr protein kinase RdoA (MazF antagonist)